MRLFPHVAPLAWYPLHTIPVCPTCGNNGLKKSFVPFSWEGFVSWVGLHGLFSKMSWRRDFRCDFFKNCAVTDEQTPKICCHVMCYETVNRALSYYFKSLYKSVCFITLYMHPFVTVLMMATIRMISECAFTYFPWLGHYLLHFAKRKYPRAPRVFQLEAYFLFYFFPLKLR